MRSLLNIFVVIFAFAIAISDSFGQSGHTEVIASKLGHKDQQYMPMQPFDSVSPQGLLQIQERLATLIVKNDTAIPVFLEFNPSSHQTSPFFGYGWNMPLDATIVQYGKDVF